MVARKVAMTAEKKAKRLVVMMVDLTVKMLVGLLGQKWVHWKDEKKAAPAKEAAKPAPAKPAAKEEKKAAPAKEAAKAAPAKKDEKPKKK